MAGSGARALLGKLVVDVAPLRESKQYRVLWIGTGLSAIGSSMTQFAVALQVYLLTHSSAAVGGTALVTAIPAICFGLFGGTIIDSVDRRKLVLTTSSLLAVVSGGLAAQAFIGFDHLWLVYLLVALQSILGVVNAPARKTFMPRLLRPELVPPAIALTMLSMYTATFTGPLLAGVITAAAGLKICYLIDAVSFSAALYGVARLPSMRPEAGSSRPGLSAVKSGLSFIWKEKVLASVLLADIDATVLAMPIALFPAINAERFGGSPRTLGLLPAAIAVGGFLGSGLSGPIGRIVRKGRAMLLAGGIWGISLAVFGVVDSLWATLLCLAVAGAADVSSVVLRSTIIQMATPDEYRGRVNATEFVAGGSMPQIGNFRAGIVAQVSTPGISAFSGGLSAAIGSLVLGFVFPTLVRYKTPTSSEVETGEQLTRDSEALEQDPVTILPGPPP